MIVQTKSEAPSSIDGGAQVQHYINMECITVFFQPPVLKIGYVQITGIYTASCTDNSAYNEPVQFYLRYNNAYFEKSDIFCVSFPNVRA